MLVLYDCHLSRGSMERDLNNSPKKVVSTHSIVLVADARIIVAMNYIQHPTAGYTLSRPAPKPYIGLRESHPLGSGTGPLEEEAL